MINDFGSIDVLNDLNGDNIHNLRNGFTMIQSLHTDFDNLDLWFEKIQVSIPKDISFKYPLEFTRVGP